MTPDSILSVLGEPLRPCSRRPLTGFARDGYCHDYPEDLGRHLVCARMTAEFLEHSAAEGNDLTVAHPEIGFPGLKPGDCWCVCAERWLAAWHAGCAPPVLLAATCETATQVIPLQTLRSAAIDLA